MTQIEKFEALKTVALAYLRGDRIQYDQLSMDRLLRITPRRRYLLPPEAGTAQHRLFLDCATFVTGAFYNAFGYLLEADLTWLMRELVRERVYFCEPQTLSPSELARRTAEVRAVLQPGDAVVCSRATNGHIMLYLGGGQYIHCTPRVGSGSYDYENRREQITQLGGIHVDSEEDWFDPSHKRYLFSPEVCRLAVLRPLACVGDPTPDTLARMGDARELDCEVLSAPCGGRTAQERAVYTVAVKNKRGEAADVTVRFGAETARFSLAPDERRTADFIVPVPADAPWIEPPTVTVNGLHVYAPRVLVGKNLTETQAAVVSENAAQGAVFSEMAAQAYAAIGVTLPTDHEQLFNHLFYRHDAINGIYVLSRRAQQPTRDMAVYGMFGGVGVVTPNVAADYFVRTDQLCPDDLLPGDLLLVSDDHTFRRTYGCICTGDAMIGSPEAGEPTRLLSKEEAASWLDSLPGRYAYIVLRPSLRS
ncbi:MAG: C40 family peptidase [Oscillospiraceae bacterium]|nr:C40 family peptidase [Oscillospiraceae bacterium]